MSYCIYVGKNLTADGCAYLAGYGDEPSSHWLEIVPREQHAEDAEIVVGVSPDAKMPGQLSNIPQVAETARHIRVSYSYYRGVPPPITNGGLNEYGVAVRDVWSTSRPELIAMTPTDQKGPNYSDLARLVLQRAKSAREGVVLIGELIAEYGYSTYGGNSHFIADEHEGWVVIEFAGGKGLWVAERVGPDGIRVSRPGYIGEIPTDFYSESHDNQEFMGPAHLISFAVEQGWYDPESNEPFNVNKIYGDGKWRWDGVRWVEGEMAKRAEREGKITIQDMMWIIRTPKLTGDTAGYGQVVPLRNNRYRETGVLWHTQTAAVASPFIPFFIGTQDVPPEYKAHRYLTFEESAHFIDERRKPTQRSTISQGIESTRSAFRIFKRLLYLIMAHHQTFLPEVTAILNASDDKLIAEHATIIKTAETLLEADQTQLARHYLTYYSHTEAMKALELAELLSASIEARTKLLYGISNSFEYRGPKEIW